MENLSVYTSGRPQEDITGASDPDRFSFQMPGLNPLSLILKLESLKNRLIDVLPLEALEYLTAIGTIGNTDVSAELEYLGSVVQVSSFSLFCIDVETGSLLGFEPRSSEVILAALFVVAIAIALRLLEACTKDR